MNLIKVIGKGSVHIIPDVTRITVSIDRIYKDYETAYKKTTENNQWIGKILEFNKIKSDTAKTVHMDISEHTHPIYDARDHVIGHEVDGYALDQRVRIDLGIDNVLLNNIVKGIGEFVDGATVSIGYTVKDSRPAELKMLERCVKDAKEKAEIMALASGGKLGACTSMNYGFGHVSIFAEARNYHSCAEMAQSTPDSLDITPEDLAISDEVETEWELL